MALFVMQAPQDEPHEDHHAPDEYEKIVGKIGGFDEAVADERIDEIEHRAKAPDPRVVSGKGGNAEKNDGDRKQFPELLTEGEVISPENGKKKKDHTEKHQKKPDHRADGNMKLLHGADGSLGNLISEDQGIQRHVKHAAHLHQLIQLGNRRIVLPLGDRLTGHLQLHGKIPLGKMVCCSAFVNILAKIHRSTPFDFMVILYHKMNVKSTNYS